MKLCSPIFRLAAFMVFFSCTILEDSDLITPADYEKIRLKAIEITQDVGGLKLNSTMTVAWDSAVNIPVAQGEIVTRSTGFNLGDFREGKLKFKSGESSALVLYQYFLSDGRPYTLGVIRNDVIVELYRFRYNDEKQLARISFFLGLDNLVTKDSIIYDEAGYITTITREEFNNPSPGGNITIDEYFNGPPPAVGRFYNGIYQYDRFGGNCPNNAGPSCFGFYRSPAPNSGFGGSDNKQVNFSHQESLGIVDSFTLYETRFNVGGISHEPDTYYFHPLMLFKDDLEHGHDLLNIYMIDWWSPGPDVTGSTSNRDESVKFTYVYGI